MSNTEPSRDRIESETETPIPQDLGELVSPHPIDPASTLRVELIDGKHIRAQVVLEGQDISLRVKEVSFEAIDSSGRRIASYRTIDPIHIMTGRTVLGRMKYCDERNLSAATKAILIYKSLTNSSTVRFETIPEPTEQVDGYAAKKPVIYRVIPRLDQFIMDPEVINNQFGGHWANGDIVTRISALLKPKAGFATVTVIGEDVAQGKVWDWSGKFLAPADPTMSESEVRRFLIEQARQAFTLVCSEGIEGLVSYIENSDTVDCQIAETDFVEREQLDKRLLAGDVSDVRSVEKTLESGATASLLIGQRCAVISVAEVPNEPTIRRSMIYSCSEQHEELTSWQIHYIREAYEKLTSSDPNEQVAGIRQSLSIQQFFPEVSSSGESLAINPGALSYKALEIKVLERGHTLTTLFGEELVGTVAYLPGVEYEVVPQYFDHALRDGIQGRRRLTVRSTDTSVRALRQHPEYFKEMKFYVSNDESLYVILKNGVGSRLATEISTVGRFGNGAQATMAHLIQLFANQSNESWTSLLSTIEQLKEEASDTSRQESDLVTVNDFPPSKEIANIELFEKAASMYSWLLMEHGKSFPRASLRYTAEKGVVLQVESFNEGPGFRFTLQYGIVRQVAILTRAPSWTERKPKHEVHAVFSSKTLAVESDEVREILDACSTVQHYTNNTRLEGDNESRLTKSLRILLDTLQQLMNQVQ